MVYHSMSIAFLYYYDYQNYYNLIMLNNTKDYFQAIIEACEILLISSQTNLECLLFVSLLVYVSIGDLDGEKSTVHGRHNGTNVRVGNNDSDLWSISEYTAWEEEVFLYGGNQIMQSSSSSKIFFEVCQHYFLYWPHKCPANAVIKCDDHGGENLSLSGNDS